jgi:hypothetical protein
VIEMPPSWNLKIFASPPHHLLSPSGSGVIFSPALVNGHRHTLHRSGLAELQMAQLMFHWVQIKISKNGRIS